MYVKKYLAQNLIILIPLHLENQQCHFQMDMVFFPTGLLMWN